MAKTKYHTPAAELTAGELHITLYARQHDTWLGTAEQLSDAALVPSGFRWPSRTERRSFTHNGIDCTVQRKPLPGGTRGQSWVGDLQAVIEWTRSPERKMRAVCHARSESQSAIRPGTRLRLVWSAPVGAC